MKKISINHIDEMKFLRIICVSSRQSNHLRFISA